MAARPPPCGRRVGLKIMNTGIQPHEETVVDNLRFSYLSVPELGVGGLLAAGGALLLLRRRDRRA